LQAALGALKARGIEVLRVLHGARDIQGLLAEGFEAPDEDDDELAEEPGSP